MGNIFTVEAFLGLLIVIIMWVVGKYLAPYLKTEKRLKYAEWIAKIADEVTDDLLGRYPTNTWAKFFDDAVDKVMEICGIKKEVASRAATAALKRKDINRREGK